MRTAIIVSIGADQIKERGWRSIVVDMLRCDGENALYYWRLHNQPKEKENITTAFIIANGRIRYKATVVDFLDKCRVNFHDGREMTAKWMRLIDFKPVKIKIGLKGFQGFRYVKPNSELANYYGI